MNQKEHLKAEHAKSEVFHLHRSRRDADGAAIDAGLADDFEKLGHSEIAAKLRKRADIGKGSSSLEAERADHHRQAATLVDAMTENQPYARKSAGVSSDALVPDHVTAIIGEIPRDVRPVTRHGQPPMGDHPPVPLEFEHLVKVDDE